MEKLPVHTKEPVEGVRLRPGRATFLRRLFCVVCFLYGYYLLIRPGRDECDLTRCTASSALERMLGPQATEIRHPPPPAPAAAIQTSLPLDDHIISNAPKQKPLTPSAEVQTKKIPLEAHIMSKCPDAQVCLQELVVPAMEKISDKVDFRLSMIATVSEKSSDIECMHGPPECIGDMLMLCAANLPFPATADDSLLPSTYPRTPIIRSLGFANCLINDYEHIPERELVHQCALEHGIDFDALNRCASQQNDDPNDGNGDPPSSALRGQELGVRVSCTVRLDEKVWCVHDSEWKDCAQNGDEPAVLIDEVERLYKERN
ncbi:hypothetical protein N7474_007951 [Penicillium riverlandense]|uniref:uncharacterized protein n=1 Tax=Penicillium riverlandense TaxID=1903569 RepID=UPI0025495C74|nr:uncharacterized protein N7474_007951 [Penicillium riverlandense]KAJ5811650.1 hypothetical protein N7474_007951 [Penicillium riverlandense]